MFVDGWRPDIEVLGEEWLAAAERLQSGVVLWRMSFADPTPLNLALAERGTPAVHLSVRTHGITPGSWMSAQVFGPLVIRAECRHLGERVVFADDQAAGALRRLQRRLAEGAVVTIVGDGPTGQRNVEVPVLGELRPFATGAPWLAHVSAAPLLTAAVLWRAPGRYRVIIDPPIEASRHGSRGAFQRAAVEEFARRLEGRIREHPESRLWLGQPGASLGHDAIPGSA